MCYAADGNLVLNVFRTKKVSYEKEIDCQVCSMSDVCAVVLSV